ncbi:MAG TPA: hypothetical protein VGM77_03545 [Gemmatimonadales bacterium]|jgi:hypothetical protein
MDPTVPTVIDRATLDRVLKRASELQGSSRESGELLSEDETIALGREVGLTPELVKQALIEERVRINVESPTGVFPGAFARVDVLAQRVVQGAPEQIVPALADWLESRESFVVQRSQGSVATFEPMEQFTRAMRRVGRMFRGGGRPYLERVELVKCVVTPLEAGYQHVAIVASIAPRRELVATLVVVVVAGAVAAGLLAVLGAMSVLTAAVGWAMLAAVAVTGFAALCRRITRQLSARVRLGLERALDDLQQNPTLTSSTALPRSNDIARNLGRVVRDISVEVRKALDR